MFLKHLRFDVVSGVEGADFQLFVRVLASAPEEMNRHLIRCYLVVTVVGAAELRLHEIGHPLDCFLVLVQGPGLLCVASWSRENFTTDDPTTTDGLTETSVGQLPISDCQCLTP